jgi:hypothetical protein
MAFRDRRHITVKGHLTLAAAIALAVTASFFSPASGIPLALWRAVALAQAQGTAAMTVQVRLTAVAGAPSALGGPGRSVDLGPGAELVVQVLDPLTGIAVFEGRTDADGTVQGDIPAGRWWIAVQYTEQLPGMQGAAAAAASLPNGRPVFAWAAADVPDGSSVEVRLAVSVSLPLT